MPKTMKRIIFLIHFLITSVINLKAQAPKITDFSPSKGPIGTLVTITGNGFNSITANNIVLFGATRATVTNATSTRLEVIVPNGATPQFLSVTNNSNNLTGFAKKIFNVTFPSTFNFLPFSTVSSNGSSPVAIQIGDFDNDNKPDINVTNYGQRAPIEFTNTTIIRNLTTSNSINLGNSTSFDIRNGTESSCIGDIDGDGKLDVVVTGTSVLRNISTTGNINFEARKPVKVSIAYSPYTVTTGDLDLDGKPEIIGAAYEKVVVYQNESTIGNINFTNELSFDSGSGSSHLCVGDLDGDSKPDVAVFNNSNISVLRNTSIGSGNISFAAKIDFPRTPDVYNYGARYAITMGDFDGDGKLDLATSNGGGYSVSVYRNTSSVGTISFATKIDYITGFSPFSVSVGDIDGDGKPDLVSANQGSYSLSVLRNLSTPGTINFAAKTDLTVEAQPYAVAIGDLNMDGKSDLVAATSGTVSILQQTSDLKGSLYANGSFCGSGTGQLTWIGPYGSGPYTIVYNDGAANRTATNVFSGVPFNVASNPVNSTTTYQLVSVTYPNGSVQTNGFEIDNATITVQSLPSTQNVTTNINSGTQIIYAKKITATNQVSNANVEYKALQSVTLSPGFSARNTVFKAYIGGCN